MPSVDSPPRRGRPRLLSVDRVIDDAIALVEEGGVQSLTMSALAGRLGVHAMTLYGYVDSREHLIDQAIARLNVDQPMLPDLAPGEDWIEVLVAHMGALRAWAVGRPALFALSNERPGLTDTGMRLVTHDISLLMGVGFDAETAAAVRQTLGVHLLGQVGFELARRGVQRETLRGNAVRLTGDDVPKRVSRGIQALGSMPASDFYELGVRALLAGFAVSLPGRARPA
jgi:TetR/AcrR family tetracycline transcriptional repressor